MDIQLCDIFDIIAEYLDIKTEYVRCLSHT